MTNFLYNQPQDTIESEHVLAMEDLPINADAGQSYGYTLYRTTIPGSAGSLDIKDLRDYGQVSFE